MQPVQPQFRKLPGSHRRALLTLLLSGVLMLALPLPEAGAGTLRCDGSLVRTGDRKFEVREACGEPDVVVPLYSVPTAQYGPVVTREEWQYNFGPQRLVRFMRFQDGRLVQIRSGRSGFRTTEGSCSSPGALERGISELELRARCGEPEHRETIVIERSYRLENLGLVFRQGLPGEEWLYEFGSGRFPRIVTVVNGRVVDVEKLRRRG